MSVKLLGPLIFFFLDGFCFLCQLNCPDLCFFFFLMGFVFCDSYYSTGALCTRFTLVSLKRTSSVVTLIPKLAISTPDNNVKGIGDHGQFSRGKERAS
jgi:hypothetical protein